MATISETQQLYVAYFGRPADPAGLDYWVSTGITTKNFAAAMYAQPEFQQANANLSVTNQVNALYLNLFGRNGDTEGLLYWTQQINTGKLTLASIANDLIFAANNSPAPQSVIDKAVLNNKTATAEAYTTNVRAVSASLLAYNPTSTTPWVTGPQFTSAVTYLATVTTTAPTAAATTAAVATMTAIVAPGQTFTLTTGQFSYTGTSGNDTFIGVNSSAATNFSASDTIDGGSGTNTLSLGLIAAYTGGATISNIQNLRLTQTAVGGFNATGIAGLRNIETNASSVDIGVTNLASAANISVSNQDTAVTITYADAALAGSADAVSLSLNNVAQAGATAIALNTTTATTGTNGIETLNVILAGAAGTNAVTVSTNAAQSLRTVNISGGAGNLTLGTNVTTTATTVNGSASTGALSLAGFGAVNTNVTGGTGGDTFNFGVAGNFTSGDTVNGGAGTDTLRAAAADIVAFTTAATNVSLIETIALGTDLAGGTVDVSLFGASNIRFATAQNGTSTVNGLADNASVRFDGASAGAINLNIPNAGLPGTANTLRFDLRGGNVTYTAATAGVETLNIDVSNQTGAGTLALTNVALTTVGITNTGGIGFSTGTLGANVSVVNAGAVTGAGGVTVTLNGTANTGATVTGTINADALNGSNLVDVINGGLGNDTIVGADGADRLTGGGGNDQFRYDTITSTATVTVFGSQNITTADIITDFGSGDIWSLLGAAGATAYTSVGVGADNIFVTATNTSGLTAAATLVNNGAAVERGSYNVATGAWTAGGASATGSDILFVFDTNGAIATTAYRAVVLQGAFTAFNNAATLGAINSTFGATSVGAGYVGITLA